MDIVLERLDEPEDVGIIVDSPEISIARPEFVIGRAGDCQLQIASRLVSRHPRVDPLRPGPEGPRNHGLDRNWLEERIGMKLHAAPPGSGMAARIVCWMGGSRRIPSSSSNATQRTPVWLASAQSGRRGSPRGRRCSRAPTPGPAPRRSSRTRRPATSRGLSTTTSRGREVRSTRGVTGRPPKPEETG